MKPSWVLSVLATAATFLLTAPARAITVEEALEGQEHILTLEKCINLVGREFSDTLRRGCVDITQSSPMPGIEVWGGKDNLVLGEDKAEMADISTTFRFSKPTTVYIGELVLKLDGDEVADADVIVFLRGGKIVGVELTYLPHDSTEFGALPFDEQLARYDYLYAHITNNYSGSDLGETLIYDDSGGLYEWRDGSVWWVLSWTPDVSLSLSFVSPAFKDEHYLDLMDRTRSNLAGQDYDDHSGHDHDDHAGHSH